VSARVVLAALATAAMLLVGACAPDARPPRIRTGDPCAACGMTIADLRFACERKAGKTWRAFDSIECLLREGVDAAYLADYDTRALHAGDSLWVVRGAFPSPMGGGYAAFLDRDAADDVAMRTHGRVARLAAFASSAARGAP
jgi:nitrous oxide reductase accessory protein NosL